LVDDAAPLDVVVEGAVDLVAGAMHACALLRDGSATCWGNNRFGVLGREPDRGDEWHAPAPMPGLSDVVALAARDAFYQFDWTCALQKDGEVACWGYNLVGVTRVPELKGARAIRVGDGEVYG
jgi:alpha-tubulin suppressor-like RCC1 family protein